MPANEKYDAPNGITKITSDRHYGCHNRNPYRQSYTVQHGWKGDGRRKTIEVPHTMSTECTYDERTKDPRCAGCKHIGLEK